LRKEYIDAPYVGGGSVTVQDYTNIAGGYLRDTLASPVTLSKIVPELILDSEILSSEGVKNWLKRFALGGARLVVEGKVYSLEIMEMAAGENITRWYNIGFDQKAAIEQWERDSTSKNWIVRGIANGGYAVGSAYYSAKRWLFGD
jgi:hypothetical protein